jgi:hypothetical protein
LWSYSADHQKVASANPQSVITRRLVHPAVAWELDAKVEDRLGVASILFYKPIIIKYLKRIFYSAIVNIMMV